MRSLPFASSEVSSVSLTVDVCIIERSGVSGQCTSQIGRLAVIGRIAVSAVDVGLNSRTGGVRVTGIRVGTLAAYTVGGRVGWVAVQVQTSARSVTIAKNFTSTRSNSPTARH